MGRRKGSKSPFENKAVREKSKQTNMERYGVDNPFKSQEVQQSIRQTNMERYGVDNPFKSQEVQQRCRENFAKTMKERKQRQFEELEFVVPDWDRIRGTRTMSEAGIRNHYPKFYRYIMDNYPEDIRFKERLWMYQNNTTNRPACKVCGGPVRFVQDHYSTYCSLKCANSDPEKQDRTKLTVLEKYGVSNVSQVAEVKRRKMETTTKHYGVSYISQSPEVKEKIKQTCIEKYGVEWPCMTVQAGMAKPTSGPNDAFAGMLDKFGIEYTREFTLGKFIYDFKVGNTLIEVNPTITHNINFNPFNDPIERNYHKDKSTLAKSNGYHCIHIWDWDDPIKIIHIIQPRHTIAARKCRITEPSKDVVLQFLHDNHLQGACRGMSVGVGIYYKDELVGVMVFGTPRYNKKYEYELLRLCFKSDTAVIGGTQKMFRYFVEHYVPSSIISYCDDSKFDGTVYQHLKFTWVGSSISRHWYNIKSGHHITDNLLRSKGFDNIFGTHYGKGTSNNDLMRDAGYLEVYDTGQSTWVWRK